MTTAPRRLCFVVALATPSELERHAPVLCELAGRGHQVDVVFVTAGRLASRLAHQLADESAQITLRRAPKASDRNASNLRAALVDCAGLAAPYAQGSQVALGRRPRRVSRDGWGPTVLAARGESLMRRQASRGARTSQRLLDAALAVDADPGITEWLKGLAADVLVCAPLGHGDARELDMLRAARQAEIPTALLVGDIDQLAAAGSANTLLDRILVWNNWQLDLAVRRHGVRAQDVSVVGAPVSDTWYPPEGSEPRRATTAEMGVREGLPHVVVYSSARALADDERALVRALGDDLHGRAGIIVRPLSGTAERWESLPATGSTPAIIWPSEFDGQIATLYDASPSLVAAVGTVASDLLDAAVLGLPSYVVAPVVQPSDAILRDVAGGPIRHLATVEGFGDLLAAAPSRDEARRGRADDIVRPRGRDRSVAPLVADELEQLAARGVSQWVQEPGLVTRTAMTTAAVLSSPSPGATLLRSLRERSTAAGRRSSRPAITEAPQATLLGPWEGGALEELLYWIPWVRGAIADFGRGKRVLVAHRGRDPRWYTAMSGAEVMDIGNRGTATVVTKIELDVLPGTVCHVDDHNVRERVRRYRSGRRGLRYVLTWGGARQARVEAVRSGAVVVIVDGNRTRRVAAVNEAVDTLMQMTSDDFDESTVNWVGLTDAIAGAELVCVAALAPAALSVSLGVATLLVADDSSSARAADINALDRVAAALGVELTVMSRAAITLLAEGDATIRDTALR